MKGNRPQPSPSGAAAPLSPTTRATAKYTNKDGSKFITVPKVTTPVESAQPSPTPAPSATGTDQPPQPVNRKKQKRRAKAAAKAAAEQAQHKPTTNGVHSPPPNDQQPADAEPEDDEEEAVAHPEPQSEPPTQQNAAQTATGKKKSKKKKKKQNAGQGADGESQSALPAQSNRPGMSREKIWNTDSQEERERIKEFWLGLSEAERKSLVKVEKDAVLKKMKEQQKHTCSCTVCGRKRTAIEEELEGLYDAYYEELEQYANHPNQGEGPPMLRPRRSFGSAGGMRPRGLHSRFSNHQPSRGRIMDDAGDEDGVGADEDDEGEDDGDDIYSAGELEDDYYSDDEHEPSEELHRSDYAAEFFNFGNSLTVQGGILTVADDLLKNDGKKFIEMMEQLAERRMAREEDARNQFTRGYDHVNGDRYHSHPPPPDDDEYEDEEDDYVDEDEEEEYDSQDEEDTMTDEQRMEEGRRMFQIFAARMFEQRVLTAYREKVAKERQAKLLEEIEAENQQDAQRKAKKAKEAQKRKEKAQRKKEQLAEEKARREAEKAAEEAARRAEEERKAEEARAKAEERRKKKEAQRKAEEEERQRKEAERLRKIQEREEAERKAREAKEREKKVREQKEKEARERKEREAREKREQQEREARERKEQQERERREKEAKAKAEREAKEATKAPKDFKEGKDTKEKRKKEDKAPKAAPPAAPVAVPTPVPKRAAPQQPAAPAVPVPPVAPIPALPQQAPKTFASPQIQVATPALPKAPTPIRPRQSSQHEGSTVSSGAASNAGSRGSQNPSPHPVTPIRASPGPIAPPSKSGAASTGSGTGGTGLQTAESFPYSASPTTFPAKPLPTQHASFGLPPPGPAPPFPPGLHNIPPGFGAPIHRDPTFPPIGGFRNPHSMVTIPPGFGAAPGNRGFPLQPPPGLFNPVESTIAPIMGPGLSKESPSSHSRQGSASLESGATQPISRPTPIGRPASVVQGQQTSSGSPSSGLPKPSEPDTHLGSRALLDDVDNPLPDFPGRTSRVGSLPGTRPTQGFAPLGPYGLMDPLHPHNPWGAPGPLPPANSYPPPPPGFAPSPLGMPAPMHVPWGHHPMSHVATFGPPGVALDRPIEPRAIALRKMLRRACEELAANATTPEGGKPAESGSGTADGTTAFVPLDRIKAQVELFNGGFPVDVKELEDICETEGNEVNGGGSFDVRDEPGGGKSIRFVAGTERMVAQPVHRAVGYHPGSPSGPAGGAIGTRGSTSSAGGGGGPLDQASQILH
ncbi:hypothetical protein VTJ49DRAFT_5044 [Mycothermus thermophilus]|uniref:Stress response protein NST1 n=1 Tax=Humicola insolens TaxID=85995 RepID=A0ABR3V427_HUMIN